MAHIGVADTVWLPLRKRRLFTRTKSLRPRPSSIYLSAAHPPPFPIHTPMLKTMANTSITPAGGTVKFIVVTSGWQGLRFYTAWLTSKTIALYSYCICNARRGFLWRFLCVRRHTRNHSPIVRLMGRWISCRAEPSDCCDGAADQPNDVAGCRFHPPFVLPSVCFVFWYHNYEARGSLHVAELARSRLPAKGSIVRAYSFVHSLVRRRVFVVRLHWANKCTRVS